MSEKKKSLTAKERSFIEQYCSNGFNATKAAKDAGYSEKTATAIGSENLRKPHIQEEVFSFLAKATERALCTTEMVVQGLLAEARCEGEGSSHSARVAAWKALSDFTGGFDANKQKLDHTSSDGSMTPPSVIELVSPDVKSKD